MLNCPARTQSSQHPFYAGLDWTALRRRAVSPPFVPQRGRGDKPEEDPRNIDKEFLKMSASEGSTGGSMGDRGMSESSAAAAGDEVDLFKGFSFVDSALS